MPDCSVQQAILDAAESAVETAAVLKANAHSLADETAAEAVIADENYNAAVALSDQAQADLDRCNAGG